MSNHMVTALIRLRDSGRMSREQLMRASSAMGFEGMKSKGYISALRGIDAFVLTDAGRAYLLDVAQHA